MIRSMTAYGRATTETQVGLFVVEILSVNRKHLDVQLYIPKVLNCLDVDIRKCISNEIKRGQVTIRITPHFDDDAPIKVTPNLPLARQLHQAWSTIVEELGVDEGFSLKLLKQETGLLIHDDDIDDVDTFRSCLQEAVAAALKPMLAMKENEGKALQTDFLGRLKSLEKMILEIETKTADAPSKFREKLTTTINEVLPHAVELEERILQEICIYAEKVDTAEEITRFKSHINQMEETIKGNNAVVGKTLEFLLQEMSREINTIGSKSSDLKVAHLVVDIKTELERIREQVQNVE